MLGKFEFFKKKSETTSPTPSEKTQTSSIQLEEQIDYIFENPEIKSATTIEYRFSEHEGRELKPGHNITFIIPNQFKGRLVRDVILQHRKAEKYRVGGTKAHDPNGAYSRIELHDTTTKKWTKWVDPKGYSADKYAEWRGSEDPENEVLHDWLATVGEISSDKARVTNVGEHAEYSTSQIHSLEIVFYPSLEGVNYTEKIYTPETSFIDIEKKKLLPKYGGGSHTEGIYKNAIALNGENALYPTNKDPGPGAKLEHNRIILDLEPNKNLIQIEIAVGDTEHLSEINTKTGHKTRLGYAKLWVGIKHENGQIDYFIKNANIPPQGIIAGGPLNSKIEKGDKLVIEARADTAYVMGWRLAYEK